MSRGRTVLPIGLPALLLFVGLEPVIFAQANPPLESTRRHLSKEGLASSSGSSTIPVRYLDIGFPVYLDDGIPPLGLLLPWTPDNLVYNSLTKRFFVPDFFANVIHVFDATSELPINDIPVPSAWSLDQSPDQHTIYGATSLGDFFALDAVSMTVIEWVPFPQIGYGYFTMGVHVLADGRFALFGITVTYAANGPETVVIWNRDDNSLTPVFQGSSAHDTSCGVSMGAIGYLRITPDRTKLFFGSLDSDETVCSYDTVSGEFKWITGTGNGTNLLLPTDGNEFMIYVGDRNVVVYDMQTFSVIDNFPPPSNPPSVESLPSSPNYVLSLDGNTLYSIDGGIVTAFDWHTHTLLGWTSSPQPIYYKDLIPLAVDETGLIAGLVGWGVGFIDTSSLLAPSSAPGVNLMQNGDAILPHEGPVSGGTSVAFTGLNTSFQAQNVLFGSIPGTDLTAQGITHLVNTPPQAAGPVDVSIATTNGALLTVFNGFSYGPSVEKALTNASTAEGGSTVTIFGHGLFDEYINGGFKTAPQVTIGGNSATFVAPQYFQYSDQTAPTPLELIQVVIPPGTAGQSGDIVVSNSSGSGTLKNGISFVPETRQYPLPGAQLAEGIYDQWRDVYYFADQSQIQVFSRTLAKWLTPINIPKVAGQTAQRLWAISLSPNGSKLAVSDFAGSMIDVLNPDNPSAVRSFSVASLPGTNIPVVQPCGLAVTDRGVVYFSGAASVAPQDYANVLAKVDTVTGAISTYTIDEAYPPGIWGLSGNIYNRVLLTRDNLHVYYSHLGGSVFLLDTQTDQIMVNPLVGVLDGELSLAANGVTVSGSQYLLDSSLNIRAQVAANEITDYDKIYNIGEKTSPDGKFLFQLLQQGIVVVDAYTGLQVTRVGLPLATTFTYDALVTDTTDDLVVAITGTTGDGITIIDLAPSLALQPSLTANPNPIPADANSQLGQTNLTWNAPGHTSVQIIVGGTLFVEGGPSGSARTGDWVSNGTLFSLVDATSHQILATTTVNLRDCLLRCIPGPLQGPAR